MSFNQQHLEEKLSEVFSRNVKFSGKNMKLRFSSKKLRKKRIYRINDINSQVRGQQ